MLRTGAPLVLYYDSMTGGGSNPQFDWMRRQLAKLGVQLDVRATDYNRFQDKMRRGSAQIFFWGWNADYPDAENFLFLLYGPNAKAKTGGENAANYDSPEYDKLFEQMKLLDDGPGEGTPDRPHGRHRAARRALDVRLLPHVGRRLPAVGRQRQAHPDGAQHPAVHEDRSGTAAPQDR